jgi:hypothetical protein
MIAVDFVYAKDEAEVTPEHLTLAEKLDADYRASFSPLSIELPDYRLPCSLQLVKGRLQDHYGSSRLLLELSNPIRNPYSTGDDEDFGVFARLSVGGRTGAGWYWAALSESATGWEVRRIVPLEISDG